MMMSAQCYAQPRSGEMLEICTLSVPGQGNVRWAVQCSHLHYSRSAVARIAVCAYQSAPLYEKPGTLQGCALV